MDEADKAIKKAEETLNKVNLSWSAESTATAGVGYAVLALAKVLQAALQKKD
jgi:hypothetical protein